MGNGSGEELFASNAVDDHRLQRHILMALCIACWNGGDDVNNVHAFDDFTENCIAESTGCLVSVIKVRIVDQIDEELTARAIHDLCACHCQRSAHIFQFTGGLILDGFKS